MNQADAVTHEKHDIACDMMHWFKWDKWTTGTPTERACNSSPSDRNTSSEQEDGKKRWTWGMQKDEGRRWKFQSSDFILHDFECTLSHLHLPTLINFRLPRWNGNVLYAVSNLADSGACEYSFRSDVNIDSDAM